MCLPLAVISVKLLETLFAGDTFRTGITQSPFPKQPVVYPAFCIIRPIVMVPAFNGYCPSSSGWTYIESWLLIAPREAISSFALICACPECNPVNSTQRAGAETGDPV